jgi:hypothetical protein
MHRNCICLSNKIISNESPHIMSYPKKKTAYSICFFKKPSPFFKLQDHKPNKANHRAELFRSGLLSKRTPYRTYAPYIANHNIEYCFVHAVGTIQNLTSLGSFYCQSFFPKTR